MESVIHETENDFDQSQIEVDQNDLECSENHGNTEPNACDENGEYIGLGLIDKKKMSVFFEHLSNHSPYEFIIDMLPSMERAMHAAGFGVVSLVVEKKVSQKRSKNIDVKVKKLSGYNLFMRETKGELKAEKIGTGRQNMEIVSERWKGLSDEMKDEYGARAAGVDVETYRENKRNKGSKTSEKVRTKALSGYQFFMKHISSVMKENKEMVYSSKDRMKEIGRQWKLLDKTEQTEWTQKAIDEFNKNK